MGSIVGARGVRFGPALHQARKRGHRPNSYQQFHDGLRVRGYASYDAYLASEAWQRFKEWFFRSGLPSRCLVCNAREVVLHHWTYENVGFEHPGDVVPLCDDHHHELHRWLASKSGERLGNVKRHLIACFGKTPKEADKLFRPFLKAQSDAKKPRCKDCRRPLAWKHKGERCWECKEAVQRRIEEAKAEREKRQTQPKPRPICPECGKTRTKVKPDGRCHVCHYREQAEAKKAAQRAEQAAIRAEAKAKRPPRVPSVLEWKDNEAPHEMTSSTERRAAIIGRMKHSGTGAAR